MAHPRLSRVALAALLLLGAWGEFISFASATVIEGVQVGSLDQPRVNAVLRRTAAGDPLLTSAGFLPMQAFLDTGASGILLSKNTANNLGVQRATVDGSPVTFADVGVGGSEYFDVSESLYVALAPTNAANADNPATQLSVYNQVTGPVRTQISRVTTSIPELEDLDVVGMPTMVGKVVVMDPRPLEDFWNLDLMHTYICDPGAPFTSWSSASPGIPTTNRHVQLSYASFERFTEVLPEGASAPTMANNPFIGPNPVAKLDPEAPADGTPGVTVAFNGFQATGSFLLDTGAAASMISTELAARLHLRYVPGTEPGGDSTPVLETFDPEHPELPGQTLAGQFQMDIGGIGGTTSVAGFRLSSFLVPTVEGDPLDFLDAPVLVADITVQDPITSDILTLDGIFGMNFMVASVDLTTWDIRAGAFDWIVFDEPNHLLGLELRGAAAFVPEPGAFALLAAGALALLVWRRIKRRPTP